jgi:trimeric autotransporter adhesin
LALVQKHWFSSRVACGFFLLSFLLGGCAQNQPATMTEPLVRHSSVHGGQQPVVGATLVLYTVGMTGDGSPATSIMTSGVTSDANGGFDLAGTFTCPSPQALVYIAATGGNPGLSPGANNTAIALMAALGPCNSLGASTFININELTTVAAVWSLAPFMSSYSSIGSDTGDASALASAFTQASQYVNTTIGTAPGANVPAGTTVPVMQLNTLANILSSCVNSAGGVAGDGSPCGTLFAATTPTGGTAPLNVIGAGLNIANNPTANISTLYGLVQAKAPFQPMLPIAPADWTVQLAAPAGLLVSSNTLTFPEAYLSFVSAPQILTLTNAGAQPLTLSQVEFNGADAGDFSFSQETCSVGGTLAGNASCTFGITFSPSVVGARTAFLNLVSTAPNSPSLIALTGTGQAGSGPPLVFSPSSLDFYQAGVPQNVTVANNGSSPVFFNKNLSPTCGTMLAAQSICTISTSVGSVGPAVQTSTWSIATSTTAGVQTIPIRVEVSPLSGVTFSATSVTFGNWGVGVTSPMMTIQNVTTTVSMPQIGGDISGPNASDFAFVISSPFVGTGYGCYNTFCVANVTFKPTGTGLRTAMISTSMGDVQLSGTGTPAGASFVIGRYPNQSVAVGSSNQNTVSLTNNGSTMITPTTTITGTNASDFSITHTNLGNLCGSSLASASVCQFVITFAPSQVGTRTATLTVTDSSSGISNAITLTASGQPSSPMLTPANLTFGNIAVGANSPAQTVAISAFNGDPVTISPVNSGDFTLSPGSCATQTPCQASLTFTPSATGFRFEEFQVLDTVSNTVGYIQATGIGGLALMSLSTSSLTFPARNEGTTSIPQTATLTNTGVEPLTISGVTLIGANTGDFSFQGNTCGSSVAAGASCAISVSFNPTASGVRSAILQIVSNAPSSPDNVQLSGNGN